MKGERDAGHRRPRPGDAVSHLAIDRRLHGFPIPPFDAPAVAGVRGERERRRATDD